MRGATDTLAPRTPNRPVAIPASRLQPRWAARPVPALFFRDSKPIVASVCNHLRRDGQGNSPGRL